MGGWSRGVGVEGVRVRRGWGRGSWGGAGRVGAREPVVCGGWGGVEFRGVGVGGLELGPGGWCQGGWS